MGQSMRDVVPELYGLQRLRLRFLEMLLERQTRIARHSLAAWDGETVAEINGNLSAAQTIRDKISGAAAPLGFIDLAECTRRSADEILAHLKGGDADLAICPGELIYYLDQSVSTCQAVVADSE